MSLENTRVRYLCSVEPREKNFYMDIRFTESTRIRHILCGGSFEGKNMEWIRMKGQFGKDDWKPSFLRA